MGLYDYLGGIQVKIFYKPIFSERVIKSGLGNKPLFYSGGSLKEYVFNEKLPLRTLYYKYPDNFIIFDPDFNNVCVIKNGCLVKIYNTYRLLKQEDMGDGVYNDYGNEYNIKTLEDFERLYNDYIEICKKIDSGTKDKDIWSSFNKKWYKEDTYTDEKYLGELLSCLLDEDEENIEKIVRYIEQHIKQSSNIVDRYLQWLEDIELIKIAEKLLNPLRGKGKKVRKII